ncbi:MAG: hypothetical protein RIQ89_2368 [Bacteroidota bacterium]|jgi:choice-of-anchor B domain-containing protein
MKKCLLALLLLIGAMINAKGQPFANQYMNLLGIWDDPLVPQNTSFVQSRYASCWGWTDTLTNRNYAIIGSSLGTHIIEVTDPQNPVERDYVPGRRNNVLWREYKSYGNYLYMISDDNSPNSFQIADMSFLPDSVHVVYDSDTLFRQSHTLYVAGDKLYTANPKKIGVNKSMGVYSLANPAVPSLLRYLNDDYPAINQVHDMLVINDTVYANCGFDGLHVYTFSNGVFNELSSLNISSSANYNHSCAIDKTHRYLYYCDEVPTGQPNIIVDLNDINNIQSIGSFIEHPGSTPHNPYVEGDLLYIAYYQEGLLVYNIVDPQNPILVAYFDTYSDNAVGAYDSPAYKGAWAAYTFSNTGHTVVSDMQRGLFVLELDLPTAVTTPAPLKVATYPNPATDLIKVMVTNGSGECSYKLINMQGQIALKGEARQGIFNVNVQSLAGGLYNLEVIQGKESFRSRILINPTW